MTDTFFPGRKFSALLFDFDGTLADTMPAHFKAWNAALAGYGQRLTLEQHLGWAGQPTREIVKLLNDLHGVEMSYDVISAAKEKAYFETVAETKSVPPVAAIVRAHAGQLPMAIVSGSRRRAVQAAMQVLGLGPEFNALVCAEDYSIGKPAPDCFLRAAELLGVKPGDCLAFEDAEFGIRAATSAGMACVRVSGDAAAGFILRPVVPAAAT